MTGYPKAFSVLIAVFEIFCLFEHAYAQSEGNVNGFKYELSNLAQTDWALSTSGIPNPNNIGSLSTAGNTWNLMAYRLDSLLNARLGSEQANALGLDDFAIFIHSRLWSDLGPMVDGYLPAVNAEGFLQRYPGNGWAAQVADRKSVV